MLPSVVDVASDTPLSQGESLQGAVEIPLKLMAVCSRCVKLYLPEGEGREAALGLTPGVVVVPREPGLTPAFSPQATAAFA